MEIFEANMTHRVSDYLVNELSNISSFELANQKMFGNFGILNFFEDFEELGALQKAISQTQHIRAESDRTEYGDFQTNAILANQAIFYLASKNISPEILIEPTCGKGSFILAALGNFKHLNHIFGVEIYKPYVWETKFNVVDFFLLHPDRKRPEILISHCNVFDFDFKPIALHHPGKETLVIGNPPWVTNAKLGSLHSINLPKKNNLKNHSGLDAITGKGNFDIAESITLKMMEAFQHVSGHLLFVVKNSVIKNLVHDQIHNQYRIGSLEKQRIDTNKEFNVSVNASLFVCKFNSEPALVCQDFNFYDNQNPFNKFGWSDGKFVSNIDNYLHTKLIDHMCSFLWRQGLKHDCSSVMELDKLNEFYLNGFDEKVNLEDGLVYGILKSSDLKNTYIAQTRKFTIVTQKKVGQETNYIEKNYPLTYNYLKSHKTYFDGRKSSIYKNKPSFSIFGIGDYSFKPYKIAISGLYKTFHFTLVLPQDNKPVMLDDTCYFIGFETIEYAIYSLILLNSDITTQFLQSVTFADAKRTFTKDILMRIDLLALAKITKKEYLINQLEKLNKVYRLSLSLNLWPEYLSLL